MNRSSSDQHHSLVERATHDLLNPVSSILGLGETLRTRGAGLGDETIRAFGDSLVRQAARLQDAIRDLSTAEALLRQDAKPELREIRLGDLLQRFASERVRVEVPSDLRFEGDPDLLAEAVGRLVLNASGFSEGEVIVRAGGQRGLWIEIVDRGIGFDPDGLARAFEGLAPGTNVRHERGPGLGLGLFIARRLVEAHGGRLTATSTPGEGSVFRIELPA